MSRLLTEEEMKAVLLKVPGRYIDKAAQVNIAHIAIAKAQRDLTHKETLKAVGEWLNKGLNIRGNKWAIIGRLQWLIETLKRGEMPKKE